MIGQVNFTSTNLLQNYATTPIKEEAPNAQPQQEIAPEIVSKEAAEATKVKALVAPKAKPAPEKKSLDEYKADLIKEGKVEGKDFKVEIGELASKIIIYKDDKPSKVIRYDKDGKSKDDFESIQEFSYPIGDNKGLKRIETTYGADGEFHFRTNYYDRENSPYKNELVSHGANPYELGQKLKADGIQFSRDNEYTGGRMITKTTAFDTKTGNITRYEFYHGSDSDVVGDVAICNIGKDGSKISEIYYGKDETSYTEFEDNFKA